MSGFGLQNQTHTHILVTKSPSIQRKRPIKLSNLDFRVHIRSHNSSSIIFKQKHSLHHTTNTHTTMSITTPLLKSPLFKHKPLLPHPLNFSLITTRPSIQPIKPLKFSPIKSHLTKPSKTTPFQNPLEVLCNTIFKTLKSITKPAKTAILIGVLLTVDFNSAALAASGGRIGGRSFSRSSSSSSYSRSYSVPRGSSSEFSHSVPRGSSSEFSHSVPRGSSSEFSYSVPRGSSSEFSYSVPRGSSSEFSYSVPYYGGGGEIYVGPAFGVGIGGGSSLLLILAGFVGFVLVSGFLSDRDEGGVLTATEKTSVLKLQVGLLGMGRALQRDLNRIAEVADTSSPEGLSYVLTETSLALLRHPDYCISAYSSVDVKRSIEDGEKRFNQLSIEERGKFDEETLVNVNNIKRQSTSSRRSSGYNNEYIVITILVAAEGVHKLPPVNGGGDLKEALQKLASIPTSKLLAVEVLWTPQNENDTLSERELLEDYPLLRPL